MKTDLKNTPNRLNAQTASLILGPIIVIAGGFLSYYWHVYRGLIFVLQGFVILILGNPKFFRDRIETILVLIVTLTIGVAANWYVAEQSTKQLQESTENAITKIRATVNPNDFKLRVSGDGKSFEPNSTDVHLINLKNKEIPLDIAITNRAKATARDVIVEIFFLKDQLEDDSEGILSRFKKTNKAADLTFGHGGPFPAKGYRETSDSVAITFRFIPSDMAKILKRVTLPMKGNTAALIIRINVQNLFLLKYQVLR